MLSDCIKMMSGISFPTPVIESILDRTMKDIKKIRRKVYNNRKIEL